MGERAGGKEEIKQLEDCSISKFNVDGELITIGNEIEVVKIGHAMYLKRMDNIQTMLIGGKSSGRGSWEAKAQVLQGKQKRSGN
ncbi:hypothetical protein QJS04_geneDACA018592 [Acorus gramineus]|uniref:Uncharacterized protein n=1 Tax=Acorus gramineus TaxID=55184 RepID=A0AAV9AK25_ACOGR|nr:hypothetical protein QJS04_geneDACA018592 [Acorus gramineus]